MRTAHLAVTRGHCRRSWHLPEMVGFGGCPGVKGPFPQPVSMSGGESTNQHSPRQRRAGPESAKLVDRGLSC